MTALDTPRAAPKLTAHDIFKVSDNMPSDDLAALDAYLADFASPTNADGNYACINCNDLIDGLKQALGIGSAYRWGIVHGEASCSGCGWPARGMHYVKRADGTEIVTVRNFFLPYHPSVVIKPDIVIKNMEK